MYNCIPLKWSIEAYFICGYGNQEKRFDVKRDVLKITTYNYYLGMYFARYTYDNTSALKFSKYKINLYANWAAMNIKNRTRM